jgi:hypothetical protein
MHSKRRATDMNTLPDKPSALIRLALADLRKVEQDPSYEVDMNMWHVPRRSEGVCSVCLAGAVMAKTFNAPRSLDCTPAGLATWLHLDRGTSERIASLDYFRRGHIHGGLVDFYGDWRPEWESIDRFRDVPGYYQDKEGFHAAMENLAADLEQAGH